MKAKILPFFLFFLSTLFLMSCHKDNVASSSDKLVAKMIINNAVTSYTYDSQKRIIKIETIASDSVKGVTMVYDYSQAGKIIVTTQIPAPNATSFRTVNLLDANNRIEATYANPTTANVNDSSNVLHFIYNTDGQVIETYESSSLGYSNVSNSSYSVGNLTKGVSISKDVNGIVTATYESNNEFNISIQNTLNNTHFGQSFSGIESKNVISKNTEILKYNENGTPTTNTYVTDFTYSVDSDGYIVKVTSVLSPTNGGTPKTYVKSYVYQ